MTPVKVCPKPINIEDFLLARWWVLGLRLGWNCRERSIPLNREYSFWNAVDKVVSDTITRRTGQAKPLWQKLAAAAGTAAGGRHCRLRASVRSGS